MFALAEMIPEETREAMWRLAFACAGDGERTGGPAAVQESGPAASLNGGARVLLGAVEVLAQDRRFRGAVRRGREPYGLAREVLRAAGIRVPRKYFRRVMLEASRKVLAS